MAVKVMRERVATIPYQEGQSVSRELLVSQRYVWNLYLHLFGKYNVTANSGTASGVGVGRLVDIRLMLNNSRILCGAHWYTQHRPRGWLDYVVSAQGNVAVSEGNGKPTWSNVKIPLANPWSRRPHETIIDMADEQRLDLTLVWGSLASIINGGTVEWATEPNVWVIAETSEEAPPGASAGYFVQREREMTGLGTNALPDLTVDLPVGPDHNYVGMAVCLYDDDSQGTMREPVGNPYNLTPPIWELEFRGPSGHRTPWGPISTAEAFWTHKLSARHFDRWGDNLVIPTAAGQGIAPVSFMAPQGGGLVSQCLQTGDASALTLHGNLPAFDIDGVLICLYDVYQPKLR